jgi:hypothetical protein
MKKVMVTALESRSGPMALRRGPRACVRYGGTSPASPDSALKVCRLL